MKNQDNKQFCKALAALNKGKGILSSNLASSEQIVDKGTPK